MHGRSPRPDVLSFRRKRSMHRLEDTGVTHVDLPVKIPTAIRTGANKLGLIYLVLVADLNRHVGAATKLA